MSGGFFHLEIVRIIGVLPIDPGHPPLDLYQIDVFAIAESVVREAQVTAQAKGLDVRLLGSPAMAWADPRRVRQMLSNVVGNTPLLAVRCRFRGRERVVYAKAEHFNLTGSIKDRMALHILKKAYADGALHPGDTIAEATSGKATIHINLVLEGSGTKYQWAVTGVSGTTRRSRKRGRLWNK